MTEKKVWRMPHGFLIIGSILVFVTVLTWLIPAGEFERVLDEATGRNIRSEEHTSELQSRQYLVCRLLLEKKNPYTPPSSIPHLSTELIFDVPPVTTITMLFFTTASPASVRASSCAPPPAVHRPAAVAGRA